MVWGGGRGLMREPVVAQPGSEMGKGERSSMHRRRHLQSTDCNDAKALILKKHRTALVGRESAWLVALFVGYIWKIAFRRDSHRRRDSVRAWLLLCKCLDLFI